MSTVHVKAVGGRKPGPEDTPSFPAGERVGEDEHVGEDGRVDAAGPDVAPTRTGPWNRRARWIRSVGGSEGKSSCCPRRMGGSSSGCSVKERLISQKEEKALIKYKTSCTNTTVK